MAFETLNISVLCKTANEYEIIKICEVWEQKPTQWIS